MQDQNNLFSNSDDRQENLFPDFSIASINTNKGNSSSESYLKSSPFGKNSLFNSKNDGFFYRTDINLRVLIDFLKHGLNNKRRVKYLVSNFKNTTTTFEIDGQTVPMTAKVNSLEGEIDFKDNPLVTFSFVLEPEEFEILLFFPFVAYKDSKPENKFAVILSFSRSVDLQQVLVFMNRHLPESMKVDLKREFFKGFKNAEQNADILDFLYEKAPDFVLSERNDDDLYKDLDILSKEPINIWGTDENISILNIINAIKNKKGFYEKTNQDPSLIQLLFKEFSNKHIQKLIKTLVLIGYDSWSDEDIKAAVNYSFKVYEEDFDKDHFIDSRIVYWCGYLESQKRFEVGFTVHRYEKSNFPIESNSKTLGILPPFTPLRIQEEDTIYYIPTIIAEFFTNQQLEEDRNIILNDIISLMLPEATLAKFKPFLKLKLPKLFVLKFKPSWLPNRVIATKPNETVTLIGNFLKDTDAVLKELNYSQSLDFGSRIGEFNLLSVPSDLASKFKPFFWEKYNEPWLRAATNRGDDIIVLSDKYDNSLLVRNNKQTGFGKEIQYMDDLVKNGIYKFVEEEGKYVKVN